jgi:hypothetical protein
MDLADHPSESNESHFKFYPYPFYSTHRIFFVVNYI